MVASSANQKSVLLDGQVARLRQRKASPSKYASLQPLITFGYCKGNLPPPPQSPACVAEAISEYYPSPLLKL
jgi:hypothetical protein